jgi:hypothetical protein
VVEGRLGIRRQQSAPTDAFILRGVVAFVSQDPRVAGFG